MYNSWVRKTAAETELTRRALADAALAVFAERGYAAARLDDVAARAGVTRGALYHHFADKAELYLSVIGAAWVDLSAPILAELEGSDPPLKRLERFLVAYLRASERDPRFRALLAIVTLKTEALPELEAGMEAKRQAMKGWLADLEALLAEAAHRGELRADLSPKAAALTALCFLNGVTTTALIAEGLFSPAREASRLIGTLLEGMKP